MFTCPNCRTALVRRPSQVGVYWSCERCGGRAVGVALLRRIVDERVVTAAWAAALNTPAPNGRSCPVCARDMKEVQVEAGGRALALDVCQRCEFMWFDAGEFEAMPPPRPKPRPLGEVDESKLPPQVREALALERVKALRAKEADEPDNEWKTIPALFGLPVEMDSASYGRKPWATWLLAAITIVASALAFRNLQHVVDAYGLIPAQAWRYHGLTFVTSFFLHAGIWHLVGNMYFLLIFGGHVEDYLGRWRWLLVIVLASLVGDLGDILIDPHQTLPTIGASGGISGLIAFYALKFPYAQLGFIFRVYFYIRWVRFPAWVAFLLWVLLQIIGAWEQYAGIGRVASMAHLGGAAVGVAAWALWRNLDAKPAPGVLPIRVQ